MSATTVDWGLGAAMALVASVAGRRVVLRLAAPGRFGGRAVPSGRQFFDASMHLAMVLGMAVTLLPGSAIARPVLVSGFAGLGLALLGDGIRSLFTGTGTGTGPDTGRTVARRGLGGRVVRGRHRLHHAAMAGIMVLMVLGPQTFSRGVGGGTGTMAGMAMASATGPANVAGADAAAGHAVPLTLLAAFGYACVSALVFAWRVPAAVPAGGRGAGLATDGSGSGSAAAAAAAAAADSGHRCGHGESADLLGRSCEIIMFISTAVMLFPMI